MVASAGVWRREKGRALLFPFSSSLFLFLGPPESQDRLGCIRGGDETDGRDWALMLVGCVLDKLVGVGRFGGCCEFVVWLRARSRATLAP
jgi:hypothetical protein